MTVVSPTSPKPFVFVLMPFDSSFDDIYTFGIKGAAAEAGAYAERVDEQIYDEGILERIFNQINKADVVVADMTGRNANVFYEVGYAHALNKVVLLLTQHADDIPFDLKHRQHIVYGGRIDELKSELRTRLKWAIEESGRREGVRDVDEQFSVYLAGVEVARAMPAAETTAINVFGYRVKDAEVGDIPIRFAVRNDSSHDSEAITHVYVFGSADSRIFPQSTLDAWSTASKQRLPIPARPGDAFDGLTEQFRLRGQIPAMPAGGVETFVVNFRFASSPPYGEQFRLRLHTSHRTHDFSFVLNLTTVKIEESRTIQPIMRPISLLPENTVESASSTVRKSNRKRKATTKR